MDTRTLKGTELTVSRLAMGTMTFGSQTAEANAQRMVDRCLESGINFFDTANVYNQGRSEEILGRCLGGRRNRVVLASKVRGKMAGYQGLSKKAIRTAIEESLRRLGTHYLDLYYLHQPDYRTPIEETLEAMDELRREGKIRYWATSNYSAWQISEMFSICEKNGWSPPTVSQPMYNLLARGIEQEYLAFAKRFGVSIVSYNPLAGGLLTGKHSERQGPLARGRFDGNQQYLGRYWGPQFFEAVDALGKIAENNGRSLIELSLGWLLGQEAVDCVILGASKIEHLEANLAAAESPSLPPEAREGCNEAWRRLRGPTPIYNR